MAIHTKKRAPLRTCCAPDDSVQLRAQFPLPQVQAARALRNVKNECYDQSGTESIGTVFVEQVR